MFSIILRKPKFILLRSSFRHGPLAIARQIYLIALDSMLREKHLVFRILEKHVPDIRLPEDQSFTFREIVSWDELYHQDRVKVFDQNHSIDIGGTDWFERGWRLWIAETNKSLAALGWWRSAEQSRGFFCSIPDNGELLWHVTTLPNFRGMGLHVLLRITLMRERRKKGVKQFYINCRDYNIPSHRNILKMGFSFIGYCKINKWTKRKTWHPVNYPEYPA